MNNGTQIKTWTKYGLDSTILWQRVLQRQIIAHDNNGLHTEPFLGRASMLYFLYGPGEPGRYPARSHDKQLQTIFIAGVAYAHCSMCHSVLVDFVSAKQLSARAKRGKRTQRNLPIACGCLPERGSRVDAQNGDFSSMAESG